MQKIQTTLRQLRDGVAFKETQIEVRFPVTGHLHVELRDASGEEPLVGRQVTVDIPGEGKVSLTTGDDGRIFHADVPYQDFQLSLDSIQVSVPAVARRSDCHLRHVPDAKVAWVDLLLRDEDNRPLGGETAVLEGPGESLELRSDSRGAIVHELARPTGEYTVRVGELEAKIELPAIPRRQIVVLAAKGAG